MKAKHLFYSLALASAFTACTQDEMFDAPALDNQVAERPVAGVVTFVNDEVDSRYNSEAAKFENGDQLGLYLMDEFTGRGEKFNANLTNWTWQSCWWTMYNMVDYISTNYGYVYDAETGEWINRASQLVEGNYIALFPQNTRATNRQDLWHPIKANVDLVDHSSTPRYYVNRENQFFLGYEQIMRDQKAGEETGELRADITMKPIMTYAKMYFENQASNDFKIKKVVFKAHGGELLPNVAYVKPSQIVTSDQEGCVAPYWAWANHAELKKQLKDECGNVLAQSKYDRTTFSHAAARSMVQYASTSWGIPYGMTEAEATPVYEYVFNFPADADILKSNQSASSERICGISIALPAFEFEEYTWRDMEVVVYGEMWDPTINFPEGGWRPGIIRKLMNNDNGIFTLDQLKLWTKDANMQIPSVTCRIDDEYFYQNTEVRVSTTKDLYDLIEARLSDAANTENVYFDVQHYGNGLEITDEVVKLITDYEKAHNVDVVVTFNNQDQVKTPIIFVAENSIDKFEYNNGVNVVVEAPQTITETVIDEIDELRNFSTINVVESVKNNIYTTLKANKIFNEAGAVIEVKESTVEATTIHNEATINLNGAIVNGTIENEAKLNSDGKSTVTKIINDNKCINCGLDKAELVVVSGTLTVTDKVENEDVIKVMAGAALESKYLNNGSIEVAGNLKAVGALQNHGKITISATGKVYAEGLGAVYNYKDGVIDVEGSLVENIYSDGLINVIGDGKVIINGYQSTPGIIDVTLANIESTSQAAKALDYQTVFAYTIQEETTSDELNEVLKTKISSYNFGKNPIKLTWGANSAATFSGRLDLNYEVNGSVPNFYVSSYMDLNVKYVVINNNLTILKSEGCPYDEQKTAFPSLEKMEIGTGASLTVNKGAILEVAVKIGKASNGKWSTEANKATVIVDGKLKANNQSKVTNNLVEVSGKGEVWVETANFAWQNAGVNNSLWHQ